MMLIRSSRVAALRSAPLKQRSFRGSGGSSSFPSSSSCDSSTCTPSESGSSSPSPLILMHPQQPKGAAGPGGLGSGIGTDVEMIAANHRMSSCTITSTASGATSSLGDSILLLKRSHSTHALTTDRPLSSALASTSPSSSSSLAASNSLPSAAFSTTSTASAMKDEYGAMDSQGETFECPDFVLENGTAFPCQLRYQTYGELNAERDNCVVVCHALTGNASLHAWWGDLLGEHRAFDTAKYFVVCCNILGSCYGSTSPKSINPATGQPYGIDFPDVSVQDTVRLQLRLLQEQLNVSSVKAVIGGSFGGMQAVEFAVQAGSSDAEFTAASMQPYVRSVIPIACGAQHTAWQIAISEVQRQAIYKDPSWTTNPFQATHGLEVARQIGMVSYRTPKGYCEKFGRHVHGPEDPDDVPQYGSSAPWKVKSYLEYQGSKFLPRFDPVTYVKLTEQMDSHDVARGRCGNNNNNNSSTSTSSVAQVLSRVEIPALVMGIDSDILYPLYEQEELARLLPNATLKVIHSDDGHDGFLLEQKQVGDHITEFLSQHG